MHSSCMQGSCTHERGLDDAASSTKMLGEACIDCVLHMVEQHVHASTVTVAALSRVKVNQGASSVMHGSQSVSRITADSKPGWGSRACGCAGARRCCTSSYQPQCHFAVPERLWVQLCPALLAGPGAHQPNNWQRRSCLQPALAKILGHGAITSMIKCSLPCSMGAESARGLSMHKSA